MRLLTGYEINNLVRTPTPDAPISLSIKPFNTLWLNRASYDLHTDKDVIVHYAMMDNTKEIDSDGFVLLPNFLYTIKILEEIKTENLATYIYGQHVVNVNRPKTPNEHFSVIISVKAPYRIFPHTKIAEAAFAVMDNRYLKNDQKQLVKDIRFSQFTGNEHKPHLVNVSRERER